jgi:hypothetical protein
MSVPPQVWLVVGVAAVAGVGALITYVAERKRREAYTEYCLVRGFKYEPQHAQGERRFQDVFPAFKKGDGESWRHTITGEKNNAPFTAFEYVWSEGGGKSRHREYRCGVIWESDDVSFPKFALEPEGWMSKVGQMFGQQDIDFVESPEFSNTYRLSGPDESGVRALFTPEIRQFFTATPEQRVIGGGRFLIWWFAAKLPSAAALDEWLERGDQLRRRFIKT